MKKNILIIGSLTTEEVSLYREALISLFRQLMSLAGITVINAGGQGLWSLVDAASRKVKPLPFRVHMPYENIQYISSPQPQGSFEEVKGRTKTKREEHRFLLFEVMQPAFVLCIGGSYEVSSPLCIQQDYYAIRNHAIPALASPAFGSGGFKVHHEVSKKPLEFFKLIPEEEINAIFTVMENNNPNDVIFNATIIDCICKELQLQPVVA